jgi:hypothetical protein
MDRNVVEGPSSTCHRRGTTRRNCLGRLRAVLLARDEQLELLTGVLDEVETSDGKVAPVGSESGMGKSSFWLRYHAGQCFLGSGSRCGVGG